MEDLETVKKTYVLVLGVHQANDAPLRLLPVRLERVAKQKERARKSRQVGDFPQAVLAPRRSFPGGHLLGKNSHGRPGAGWSGPLERGAVRLCEWEVLKPLYFRGNSGIGQALRAMPKTNCQGSARNFFMPPGHRYCC